MNKSFTINQILIYAGLIITPFIVSPFWDNRELKFFIAFAVAVSVVLVGTYRGSLRAITNRWILLLLGYLCIQSIFIPPFNSSCDNGMVITNTWRFAPILYTFIFTLFIYSIDFTDEMISQIFTIVTWTGFLMSLYMIVQAFGFEQWFYLNAHPDALNTPANKVCGFFGHPTIAGSFLSLCLPFSIYKKKWIKSAIILIGILITQSWMAFFGMLGSMLFYFLPKTRTVLISSIIVISLLIVGVLSNGKTFRFSENASNARFSMWKETVHDMKKKINNQSFPLTGFGAGSFKVLFHSWHQNNVLHPHNEYLKILFETGIVGVGLFSAALYSYLALFSRHLDDPFVTALVSSLVGSLVVAGGTFVWNLGAHLFYILIAISILISITNKRRSLA